MAAYKRVLFFAVLIACSYVGSSIPQYGDIDDLQDEDDSTTSTTTTPDPNPDRSFSIEDSTVPNIQYDWDAVQCLSEAYMLHPEGLDTILRTFSQLFNLKHAVNGGWNANAGCSYVYNPSSTIKITLKVSEGTSETLVTLYN